MTDLKWHDDPEEVHALGSWLVDVGDIGKVRDLLAFFEKPWKWENERADFLWADERRER